MSTHHHNNQNLPHEIEEAFALFFDNQATTEVCQTIHNWLEEDPANAEVFAEYGTIEQMIYEAQKTEDASAVFALLQEAEDSAEPDFSLLHSPAHATMSTDQQTSVTLQKLWSVAVYVMAKSLKNRPVLTASIAAIFLLGLTLALVLIGPGGVTPASPEYTEQTPDWPQPHPSPIVASLTAEFDAVWDRRPGEDFYPGQRFKLTEGFAEVTTSRGALALVEAPATIELLDDKNALYLHSGKLVGLCKSASSKGFLVITPHAQITDLGTQFGVAVRDGQTTDVQVFSGKVLTQTKPASTDKANVAVHLHAGEAGRIEIGSTEIRVGHARESAFVRSLDQAATRPKIIASTFETTNTFDPNAGSGWSGPWQIKSRNELLPEVRVLDDTPLVWDSRRYLKSTLKTASQDINGFSLIRAYGPEGAIDPTLPHRISFAIRIDSPLEEVKEGSTKISIFDGTDDVVGSSGQNTWSLHGYVTKQLDGQQVGRTWKVYDGDGATIAPEEADYDLLIDTGVAFKQNLVYEVQVTVYPAESEWEILLTHEGGRYDSTEELGRRLRFRSSLNQLYQTLHFNARAEADNKVSFSIDDVRIEPVEERRD